MMQSTNREERAAGDINNKALCKHSLARVLYFNYA
jgi:hypothetical protein